MTTTIKAISKHLKEHGIPNTAYKIYQQQPTTIQIDHHNTRTFLYNINTNIHIMTQYYTIIKQTKNRKSHKRAITHTTSQIHLANPQLFNTILNTIKTHQTKQ